MTCIIGLEHEGRVYIGGDSAAVAHMHIQPTALRKVFRRGDFIIGYTSSFRMGQLLEHHLEVRAQHEDEDDLRYLVTGFIEAVRVTLRDGGYATVNNNEEMGGQFLVGYRGKLYEVGSDFQINRFVDGVAAVGCGGEYALGALAALDGAVPNERLMGALQIAGRFSSGVCPPYYVESL